MFITVSDLLFHDAWKMFNGINILISNSLMLEKQMKSLLINTLIFQQNLI